MNLLSLSLKLTGCVSAEFGSLWLFMVVCLSRSSDFDFHGVSSKIEI